MLVRTESESRLYSEILTCKLQKLCRYVYNDEGNYISYGPISVITSGHWSEEFLQQILKKYTGIVMPRNHNTATILWSVPAM